MQIIDTRLVFSPSDLNHFLECEHLIQLERQRDELFEPRRDPHADLLAAKGLAHERAWLEQFRDEGRSIVELENSGRERNWAQDAERTLAAMRDRADVIYQGVLVDDDWRGVSDFLVRCETPSSLGGWSYEAWDTKLARQSKPYFILQLCFYSGQLGRLQGLDPENMHVILGTGERSNFRYADFEAYYRSVRLAFARAVSSGRRTYPYPVSHCALCNHTVSCEERWEADDHLSVVAGIRRDQVALLNEAGVHTVKEFASMDAAVRVNIGGPALERLRHQATLQTHYRQSGIHRYDVLPVDDRIGFRLLPPPSVGDVFFDMEGDPYFEPAYGLEYLFGLITVDCGSPECRFFQALDCEQEKIACEQFVDFIHERLRAWPDLHVYHYAAYEPSALKRLTSKHATREEELDDLLRREVFVDLYQVVRQSIRISHPSYSIKNVRTFFMENAPKSAVTDGGDSILEFERWRVTGDMSILDAIRAYNEEDCVSTLKLRDWLLERKREAETASGQPIPWKSVDPPKHSPDHAEEDALAAQRRSMLEAIGTHAALLLSRLVNYHRRDAKPAWWEYYERRKMSLEDLMRDTEAIGNLEHVKRLPPERVKNSLIHTLEFPPQEYKLSPDARAQVDDPFLKTPAGTIAWIDTQTCRLGLKRAAKREEPLPRALVAGPPLNTKEQRRAIGRVANALVAGRPEYTAVRALLAREKPRVRGRASGAVLQTNELEELKELVAALESSYLLIQGPPGSGKTWAGARLIVSLIKLGHRVGVAATSHKAINNLLNEVEKAAVADDVSFHGLKKGGGDDAFGDRCITSTDSNEECEASDASLIAGTSWLFSRAGMDQRLDYLFVDEAGQVALADAVAMGACARNLVLLGDPQQLSHVRQGVHPQESGCSVLEHLLDGASTVAEDRGVFLARTWRMHPEITSFVSDLAYDGRLVSARDRDRQRIESRGLTGAGLRFIGVTHSDNAQQSPEEAGRIASEVCVLLDGGTFTDCDGRVTPLQPSDILVVAPYNMQVRCLRSVLPVDVEVGTVDKFQGREAPVVFFSMASSSGEDVPRGMDFLFSRNRFNVAVSRAKALAVVVCNPRLLETRCHTVEQMRLVNGLCRFWERASVRT